MEFLKKLASQHTNTLEELKESVTYPSEVQKLLKKWMEHQGLNWESDDDDDHASTKQKSPQNKDDEGKRESNKKWFKKVELPSFEGGDPIGWIARAEKFFEVHQIAAKEKLQLAFVSMDGAAIHWFRFWKQKNPNASWDAFTMALIRRFGDRLGGSVFERLATLRQEGSVEEYVCNFEALMSPWRRNRRWGISWEA